MDGIRLWFPLLKSVNCWNFRPAEFWLMNFYCIYFYLPLSGNICHTWRVEWINPGQSCTHNSHYITLSFTVFSSPKVFSQDSHPLWKQQWLLRKCKCSVLLTLSNQTNSCVICDCVDYCRVSFFTCQVFFPFCLYNYIVLTYAIWTPRPLYCECFRIL